MKRFAAPLFQSPRLFRPTLSILQARHGSRPIANMATSSEAAGGGRTTWQGAGAAEFDLRSELGSDTLGAYQTYLFILLNVCGGR